MVALLLGLVIVFSVFTLGMSIGKIHLGTDDDQTFDKPVTTQGKVSFYVLEKLEPQTVTGKVIFDVVEKK